MPHAREADDDAVGDLAESELAALVGAHQRHDHHVILLALVVIDRHLITGHKEADACRNQSRHGCKVIAHSQ